MNIRNLMVRRLSLAASALLCCAANLPAQTPPAITTQPANQTAPPGTNVTFSVAVAGTGPFTYQWQFNGANIPNNIITTVAGNGTYGFTGGGGAATSAELSSPNGVALDAAGNVFIADTYNQRIRKVDSRGIITTVAGNGALGYSGDGGAATNARLCAPTGASLDASGNLYIADAGNGRIRKVSAGGTITTVAGGGTASRLGDGGAATKASLNMPAGVALDATGNMYIVDEDNNRMRKVDTNGIITTVAGNGTAGFSGDGGAATNASLIYPGGVAVDAAGNLYIADSGNNRIRKVDTNGMITTVAGNGTAGFSGDGGAATNASLYVPLGLALDAFGNLYVADRDNQLIRKVDTNGLITTVAGKGAAGYSGDGGAPTNASLSSPFGVAVDAIGNLYIADTSNYRIRKALLYSGYPALTLLNVGVSNAGNYSVVISNAYGCVTSAMATLTVQAPPVITLQPINQTAVAGSSPAFSVAVAGSGPFGYLLYFGGADLLQSGTNSTFTLPAVSGTDAGNYTVVVTNAWGSVTSRVVTLTVGDPPSVAAAPASRTVLAGSNVNWSVTAGGTGPFSYVWQLNGTNFLANIITTVVGCGSNSYSGDGGTATNAGLPSPVSVVFDATGNLYIAEANYHRVRKVDTNGLVTTVAGTGTGGYSGDGGLATNAGLYYAEGLAMDAAGNLFIADEGNNRIRKVDANGIITTVAGNGTEGYSGDGSAATNAWLYYPLGVSFDACGNLYIADSGNARIRKVDTSGTITTVAGGGTANQLGDGGGATSARLKMPSLDFHGKELA